MSIRNSMDCGVRHTKERIRNAFLEKLMEKPIYKITVKELVELSGINRGTFYFHYTDIYDLEAQLENELYTAFDTTINQPYKDAYQLMYNILTLSYNNSQIICILLSPTGDPNFRKQIAHILKKSLLNLWDTQILCTTSEHVQLYSTFLVEGFIGLVEEWLTSKDMSSASDIASLYVNAIRSSYHSFMDTHTTRP